MKLRSTRNFLPSTAHTVSGHIKNKLLHLDDLKRIWLTCSTHISQSFSSGPRTCRCRICPHLLNHDIFSGDFSIHIEIDPCPYQPCN